MDFRLFRKDFVVFVTSELQQRGLYAFPLIRDFTQVDFKHLFIPFDEF